MARPPVERRVAAGLIVAGFVVVVLGVLFTRDGASPVGSGRASSPASGATAPPGVAGSPLTNAGGGVPDYVLVGAGDIADCRSRGDERTAKLLDGVTGTVFTLGDNAYEKGTLGEYRQCYDPTWGRQLGRTRPVPGNHEYETPSAAGYFDYFGAAAGDPTEGWYAYDAGSWRVYVLNSNCAAIGGCDAGSAQERWLRGDLAANPRECVLAMWHDPRFSSGQHGNDPITTPLWRDLYDAGAELILNGHDHTYERFGPQAPGGSLDPERGIVEIVVGTGGRSHYQFPFIRANSLVRDNTTYGVLRLVLSKGAWSFAFLPVAGGTFSDGGGGTCH